MTYELVFVVKVLYRFYRCGVGVFSLCMVVVLDVCCRCFLWLCETRV